MATHADRGRGANRRRNAPAGADLFDRAFEALRLAYIGELPGRIGALQATAEALASDGWNRELVISLRHEIHRLAGSSGLYQMQQLSRTAGVLEEIVTLLLNTPNWPPASSPVELTTLVKAVGRAARTETRLAQSRLASAETNLNAPREVSGSARATPPKPSRRFRRSSRSDT